MILLEITGKKYLSFSFINHFLYDKEDWARTYIYKEEPSSTMTKFLIIGKLIERIFYRVKEFNDGDPIVLTKQSLDFFLCDLIATENLDIGNVSVTFDRSKWNIERIDYADMKFIQRAVDFLLEHFRDSKLIYQHRLQVDFLGYPFIGFIDYINTDTNELYELKTSIGKFDNIMNKKFEYYKRQIILYNMLEFKYNSKFFNKSHLILVANDRIEKIEIHFDKNEINEISTYFENTIKEMEQYALDLIQNKGAAV